jgi:hypothetical protein
MNVNDGLVDNWLIFGYKYILMYLELRFLSMDIWNREIISDNLMELFPF